MPPVRDRSGAGKENQAQARKKTQGSEAAAGASADSAGTSPADGKLREPVLVALRAVADAPEDSAAWDRLEAIGVEHESPGAVADAYRKALRNPHPTPLLVQLGERAVRFH